MCDAPPIPPVATSTLPGLALMSAISSFRFFAGTLFFEMIVCGLAAICAMGAKSFSRSNGSLV